MKKLFFLATSLSLVDKGRVHERRQDNILAARFFEADTVAMPRAPDLMRRETPDAKRSGFEAKREAS